MTTPVAFHCDANNVLLSEITSDYDAATKRATSRTLTAEERPHRMSGLLNLPKLPTIKAEGRVHRIRDDEDEDQQPQQDSAGATHPRITPFIAADANGNVITAKGEPNMPKGHYERKPKAEAANDAPTLPAKRGRKPRILAVVPKVAKPNGHAPTGRFEVAVDLRAGAVTINAASGSLTLAPDEVLALFAFLARR